MCLFSCSLLLVFFCGGKSGKMESESEKEWNIDGNN